jgi:hypothetical protein
MCGRHYQQQQKEKEQAGSLSSDLRRGGRQLNHLHWWFREDVFDFQFCDAEGGSWVESFRECG